MSYSRKHKDEKAEERLSKSEMNSERALDEIFFMREQFKQLQEERKKDIEETAEFIKQIINNGKSEQAKEVNRVLQEIDKVKRELIDKSSIAEVLDLKQKIISQIENKPELKEVQQALNDC